LLLPFPQPRLFGRNGGPPATVTAGTEIVPRTLSMSTAVVAENRRADSQLALDQRNTKVALRLLGSDRRRPHAVASIYVALGAFSFGLFVM
jgi:hypothetical protein